MCWPRISTKPSIYDLAHYLRDQDILGIVAHPLYAINDRLSMDHFEKRLVLFQNFELNGARNNRENKTLRSVSEALTPELIDHLADIHDMAPPDCPRTDRMCAWWWWAMVPTCMPCSSPRKVCPAFSPDM